MDAVCQKVRWSDCWAQLWHLNDVSSLPWVHNSYLNEIVSLLEKMGGATRNNIYSALSNCALQELSLCGLIFTYNNEDETQISSRE